MNIILLRPKQFWSVFNEKKLIILKKSEKIATLTNYFMHPCPCFHLILNKIPLNKTKKPSAFDRGGRHKWADFVVGSQCMYIRVIYFF